MISYQEHKELFNSIRVGELDKVKVLLKKSGTEIKNSFGWTPLMMASFWGQDSVVQYLLGKHADPEQKSKLGLTAIMLAALRHNRKIVKLLYTTN